MNNIHRVQNTFISADAGTAMPADNSAISAITPGMIGIYGTDMLALNPAGVDTITTQPAIYIVEGKSEYVKRSMKIAGTAVTSYKAESYAPAQRNVWSIGYNRATTTGSIEVNNDTNYNFTIRFKNDKWLYSQRPELLNVNFQSPTAATQSGLATTIASTINNSSWKAEVVAIVVGNGTGVYGVTGATAFGVEITAKDVDQYYSTTYTPNQVYFSVQVNDASGFGTTTTCSLIQAMAYGSGTYNQVYTIENKDLAYEGAINRRMWPIPVFEYASSSAYISSAAIVPTVTGTIAQDTVTFSAPVQNTIIRAGEKVTLGGVSYEIKYFISSTVAVLTSPLVAGLAAAAALVRLKYDLITIEFNDSVTTPTGVVATANKSVLIAVPAITAGGAYNSLSAVGQDAKDILDAWMTSTPGAFANISI
jgi:hypothetical protein